MNIGIDIRPLMTTPRTGVGEYTYELLNAILRIDRSNQYFLFYNSWDNVSGAIPKWNYDNVRIVAKHFPNKIFNVSMRLLKYPRLDKICKCDIFFSPNLNFTSLSRKTKSILTVHDLSFIFFPEFSTRKQYWWHKAVAPKAQLRRADVIITPSENTKRDIVDYYKIASEKISVIYPGINEAKNSASSEEIEKKYSLPEKFILFLGTIEPRKNIIGLISAFEQLCFSVNSHHLVIAGAPGWRNKEIFARIENSKYADKIKLIGFIAPEDKSALYGKADIFVYPSFYEGFGFPVLEAMLANTPVITSNRSSLPEVAGTAAYLIDPTRPEQITLAMNEFLTKQKLHNLHAQMGLKQAVKFSWQQAAEKWLSVVANLSI